MGLLEKKIISDIEKSRSGIYQNTSENRRLHRVGQRYGSQSTKEISNEPSNKSKTNTYITPDNSEGYVRNLNKVLDKKGYFAHATRTGGIEIYKKGDRKSLRNLKASIIATDYINWGPNEGLRDRLEPIIKEALSSTTFSDGKVENKGSEKKEEMKPEHKKNTGLASEQIRSLREDLDHHYGELDNLEGRKEKYISQYGEEKYNERHKRIEERIENTKKEIEKLKGNTSKSEDTQEEKYTRVKFDDLPNSGKVDLKKYLTGKRKSVVDERWGKISEISTSNLQKTHDELVKKFNDDFESSKKSQRAEDLYNIMKVKNELSKRK